MSKDNKYVIIVFKTGTTVSAHLGEGTVIPTPNDFLLKVWWSDPESTTFYNINEVVFYQDSLSNEAFEAALPLVERMINA